MLVSPVTGQSCGFLKASETTLTNLGKRISWIHVKWVKNNETYQRNGVYISWDIHFAWQREFHTCKLSTLPISGGHFWPNNSRRAPIPRPGGRSMDGFCEFEVWPKIYIPYSYWAVDSNVLYCTAIYRESRVISRYPHKVAITCHWQHANPPKHWVICDGKHGNVV